MPMNKLSQRHQMRKLSSRDYDTSALIEKMRGVAKSDLGIKEKFKEYNIPLDDINGVHIEFADIDVSAKTKDGRIYLNNKLLDDSDPLEASVHYVIHELVHVLQQKTNKTHLENESNDYLDKPTEEEAFCLQVDFKRREEGEEEAEEYVDGLLSHHNLSGRERKEKKRELMDE